MSDLLERILERKREELVALRKRYSPQALEELARVAPPARGLKRRLAQTVAAGRPAVIAEIKRASPSKGLIRADFDPAALARAYQDGGASALSVLTDRAFFQGAPDHLQTARAAVTLPVLRKDFLIDPLQVLEARALGADAVLLIAQALSAERLRELAACARAWALDVLVEIHHADELERVLAAELLPAALLGINNRNLRTFETRLETTLELLPRLPAHCEVVAESGLATRTDLSRLAHAGVRRYLIGESLMRQPDPGAALRALIAA
jgi:indole-3-glycerol phosphate synthase